MHQKLRSWVAALFLLSPGRCFAPPRKLVLAACLRRCSRAWTPPSTRAHPSLPLFGLCLCLPFQHAPGFELVLLLDIITIIHNDSFYATLSYATLTSPSSVPATSAPFWPLRGKKCFPAVHQASRICRYRLLLSEKEGGGGAP